MNVRKAGRIAASAAQPYALFGIDHSEQAAVFTGIAGELIGAFHQTLLRKFRHTVCDDAVAFHFTNVYTSLHRAFAPCFLALCDTTHTHSLEWDWTIP